MSLQSLSSEFIYNTIIDGIRNFFHNSGRDKAVIGLSGGIDSAVVAALAVDALGNENVHGVLMPSQFSTLHSVNDAVELAENLNIKYDIVPIEKIYSRFLKEISPFFNGDHSWDTTQENLQARIRGTILMAYSNRRGALVLNTSNKSELSMGYGTLYGDLAGALMVIADIYKLQVYNLATYINSIRVAIPSSTILKPPSAELHKEQKDSDSLPEYHILDPILYELCEDNKTPEQLVSEGIEKELVDKIMRLRGASAFKGHQLPQIIKVSEKPLLERSKWV